MGNASLSYGMMNEWDTGTVEYRGETAPSILRCLFSGQSFLLFDSLRIHNETHWIKKKVMKVVGSYWEREEHKRMLGDRRALWGYRYVETPCVPV